jgi:hypothetical protein
MKDKMSVHVHVFRDYGSQLRGAPEPSRAPWLVCLHHRPIFSPALPPDRENEYDVTAMTLCPALKVVAVNERWALAYNLQYEEASEQPHRRLHPMNISQRWTKMATTAIELAERCDSWSP